MTTSEYYFAGRLIKNNTGYVASDRLGSIGKFYPWGQEKPSATTNGTEKFTGYYRDLETGNDYAVNRYHQPGMGRFLTADPSRRSMVPGNPGSWNRYAYVLGDPVNGRDPTGMDSGLTEEYCSSYYGMNDPGCQAGDYCEGFKACEPGSAGGDGGGVCSSDTLGALTSMVEECVDPAPPPPPQAAPLLTCSFDGAQNQGPTDATTISSGPQAGQTVYGYFLPMTFGFSVVNGSGPYTWNDYQSGSAQDTYTLNNGYSASDSMNVSESLANITQYVLLGFPQNGPIAVFVDAPGLQNPGQNAAGVGGMISAAVGLWNFSLTAYVSSGGQTAYCPTVLWQAVEIWQNGAPFGTAWVQE